MNSNKTKKKTQEQIVIAEDERALLYVDGKVARLLRPGRRRVPAGAEVRRLPLARIEIALLPGDLCKIPLAETWVVDVEEGQRAQVRVGGLPVLELGAGEYFLWRKAPHPIRKGLMAEVTYRLLSDGSPELLLTRMRGVALRSLWRALDATLQAGRP
jgi:hypothetical protein